MLRTALLFTTILVASLANAKDLSLAEIRGLLLNQEVVVMGSSFGSGSLSDSLIHWHVVTGDESTGYKKIRTNQAGYYAPVAVRGKRGVVVSVEQAESYSPSKKVGETDVFGKKIDDSRVMNPHINVVVKVHDGDLLVMTESSYDSMMGRNLQLASRADALKNEVEAALSQLIGKTLYKAGFTELLPSTMSLSDLLDYKKRELSSDRGIENLTALKVVDAKFFEGEKAVVVKVELSDGQTRLLFGSCDLFDGTNRSKRSQIEKLSLLAELKIPSKFSTKELSGIRNHKIFPGMSENALYWSWGFPQQTNDWGRGGKQHIYFKRLFVYVSGGSIRDWQSLDSM